MKRPAKSASPRTSPKRAPRISDKTFERYQSGWRFPLRLKRALAEFHWSQEDLARASGLDPTTISKVLGTRQVSFEAAGAIIRSFHFAPGWQLHLTLGLVETDLELQGDLESVGKTQEHWIDLVRFSRRNGMDPVAASKDYFRDLESRRIKERTETEPWESEFSRYAALAGLHFYSDPKRLRNEEAQTQYIKRVLRPAARAFPPAAWVLAQYFYRQALMGLIPSARRGKHHPDWSFYRTARRGKWPRPDATRPSAIAHSRQCIDCGVDLASVPVKRLRCAGCARSERVSRPRVVKEKFPVHGPPVARDEHAAILQWKRRHDWVGPDAPFDDEVRRLTESVQTDNHPLIDYFGPLVARQ